MSVDIEAMLTRFLREQPEMTALVGDRIYTDLPHERTYPCVLVTRTGGGFLINRPQWLDSATLSLQCWGGPRKQAQQVLDTAMAVLADRLTGKQAEGVVTRFTAVAWGYEPDEEASDTVGHARPRFVAQLNVVAHP